MIEIILGVVCAVLIIFLILAQKFIKGDTLVIDAEDDEIKFKRK